MKMISLIVAAYALCFACGIKAGMEIHKKVVEKNCIEYWERKILLGADAKKGKI